MNLLKRIYLTVILSTVCSLALVEAQAQLPVQTFAQISQPVQSNTVGGDKMKEFSSYFFDYIFQALIVMVGIGVIMWVMGKPQWIMYAVMAAAGLYILPAILYEVRDVLMNR